MHHTAPSYAEQIRS